MPTPKDVYPRMRIGMDTRREARFGGRREAAARRGSLRASFVLCLLGDEFVLPRTRHHIEQRAEVAGEIDQQPIDVRKDGIGVTRMTATLDFAASHFTLLTSNF